MMVNDITTLNGSLSQLGETLANNITSKGVSASASDGLTTLANKVLQITGGGGSTVIFEDDCSVDNTNQYTSTFVYWDSGQPTKTLSFVTDHYELTRNVSNFILMQLPMSANDDFIFTADILPSSTSMDNGGGIGIGVNTSNKGIGFHQTNSSSTTHLLLYNPQEGQGGVVSNVTTPNYVVDDYHTHRITKSGASFKYEVLHNDTVLFTYTKDDLATVFSSDVYPAISMGKNGTLKIKNIKVESLGGGSNVIYQPSLDGTETKTQLDGTTTVSNGVMSGGASYLATGWSNSVDYELTFEGMFQSNDYSAICLYFNNPNSRDKDNLQILSSYEHRIAVHKGTTSYNRGTISVTTPQTWSTYKLTRTGDTFTLQIDNNTATTHTYDFTGSTYENANVSIGVDTWDIGSGYGVANIRNIVVTDLSSPYSPCAEYIAEIDSAIEYINGSGS